VSVVRSEAPGLGAVLRGWDVHVAAAGRLTPWDGSPPRADRSQNNLWCRTAPDADWALDVTLSDGDGEAWVYRRDPSVRVPWAEAVLRDPAGVPYLAPELQLLHKSARPRTKDDADAAVVVPLLDAGRARRLARLLPPAHPWQAILELRRRP
jgi:hypothetical protein